MGRKAELKRKNPPRRGFIPGFFEGIGCYFRVIPTLFRYRLWPIQFIPAIMSLFLSTFMFSIFWLAGDTLAKWIDVKIDLIPLGEAGNWYSDIPWAKIDGFINNAAGLFAFFILSLSFLFVHKHIILVVLSPFLGKLAEVTYQRVMKDDATSPLTVFQSFSRGIRINLGNIFKEVFFNICFLACNLLPGFGQVIAPVGIFLNQSRFMGYGLMDSTLEHKGLTVKESLGFVNRRAGHSTGIGAGYILLMLIPVFGWMFAPTFGTVAGTLIAIDELERENPGSKPQLSS